METSIMKLMLVIFLWLLKLNLTADVTVGAADVTVGAADVTVGAADLSVGAFNIQIFGKSKSEKPDVMSVLVQILSRYDIVLIQEIRDKSGSAIQVLLEATNNETRTYPFTMVISERLGRSSSKEQYAFFYREGKGIRVVDSYVYDDGDEGDNTEDNIVDTFEREPFIVLFESSKTVLKKFAIGGLHTSPDKTVAELQALSDVFDNVKTKFNVNDVMMMGDMNADCSYVPQKSWPTIPLKNDSRYDWLIHDDVDTTVSGTHCAYDRFIVTGAGFGTGSEGGLVQGSAQVFNFEEYYNMTNEKAKDVSDHFPIELKLKGSVIDTTTVTINDSVSYTTSASITASMKLDDSATDITTETSRTSVTFNGTTTDVTAGASNISVTIVMYIVIILAIRDTNSI